jgi:hypothetical protein
MMNKIFALITVFAVFLMGCSSNPPIVDYDSSVDFSSYKTYAFISDHPLIRAEGAELASPLFESRLMRVTDTTLQAKGFTRASDPESADFTVGFTVGARDKIKVNSYPEPYRAYYGYGVRGGWGAPYYSMGVGVGSSNVDVQQYTEGTLAIDIYDVGEHKPAWHAIATKRVTDDIRRNPDESVTEIVTEMLTGFPPGSAAR